MIQFPKIAQVPKCGPSTARSARLAGSACLPSVRDLVEPFFVPLAIGGVGENPRHLRNITELRLHPNTTLLLEAPQQRGFFGSFVIWLLSDYYIISF